MYFIYFNFLSTVNHVFFVGFFPIRLTVHFFYLPYKNET
nr:MAG TPA: hypothetical protein [Caudoviricetes sp.]